MGVLRPFGQKLLELIKGFTQLAEKFFSASCALPPAGNAFKDGESERK